jgi:hypothetical protein
MRYSITDILLYCATDTWYTLYTHVMLQVVWDIMRCWVKEHPISKKRLVPGNCATMILAVEPKVMLTQSVELAITSRKRATTPLCQLC